MTNVSATHKVYDYFFQLCPDETPCHQLAALAVFKKYPAGTCILDAGGHTDYIALVLQGMVRGFYINEEGNDVTKCFSMEKEWCCSYSFLSKGPSPFYVEAIEDTLLAQFDIEKSQKLMKEYPALQKTLEHFLGKIFLKSEKRIFSFTTMEAKERYLTLLKEEPELVRRVKQEYLASYIGITPSSLSRLKKNI